MMLTMLASCGDNTCQHSYVDYYVLESTCSSRKVLKKCEFCHNVISFDEELTVGHTYNSEVTPPTCTKVGHTTYNCEVCGDSYIGDYVNATGHNFVNCTCTHCGATDPNYTDKAYIRCDKNGTHNENGNYILFGEYPQTIKADDVTITSTQDSRGYHLGSDGFYYAKITADPYSSGYYTFSTGVTVTRGTVYYFKVEPIRWRILSEDGETAFILCDSIIASHIFDNDSSNYAESEIRQWLNEAFYETAFTEWQGEIILTTTVDNSAYSAGYSSSPNACEDTEDKIFLLSYIEATNSAYGFSSSDSTSDTARRMQTSDYSLASGVWMNSPSYGDDGYWWLRSPNDNYYFACARNIILSGYADSSSAVYFRNGGIVPAMWINLNS